MWIETSLEVYSVVFAKHGKDMSVHGSFTDVTGQGHHFSNGQPTMETEWGFKDSDIPLLRIVQTKENERQKEWDTQVFINVYKVPTP